jgi:O-methyltransferase involved in polyketide biosynthesis
MSAETTHTEQRTDAAKRVFAAGSSESTSVLTALARGRADELWPELRFRDVVAKQVAAEVEDVEHWADFNKTIMRGCVVRAQLYDFEIAGFAWQGHRHLRVVEVGCGLEDRSRRLPGQLPDGTTVDWVYVDLPAVVAVREQLGLGAGATNVAVDIRQQDWMRELPGADLPTVVVSEGLSYHLETAEVAGYLDGISAGCPSGSMVITDFMSPLLKLWHPGNRAVDGGLKAAYRSGAELHASCAGIEHVRDDYGLEGDGMLVRAFGGALRHLPLRRLRTCLYGVDVGTVR